MRRACPAATCPIRNGALRYTRLLRLLEIRLRLAAEGES